MPRSSTYQIALIVVILFVLLGYATVRSHAPSLSVVNGVYRNSCCSDLTISDGVISTGQMQVPFALRSMKFGLTAYPSKRIEVQGNDVLAFPLVDDEIPALIFTAGGTAVTVCGDRRCNREYVFTRR